MTGNKSFKLLVLVPFFLFLFANFAAAGLEFPEPQDVYKTASQINFEKYPDAESALISGFRKIQYNPDGTGESIDDVFFKILTERGREENRTINFHFSSHYQEIEIISAKLIKPDGSIAAIDIAPNSRISVDHSQMGMNIYDPAWKLLTLNVPGLEIGDIIHYRYREKTVKTIMPDAWFDYIVLQYDQPIINYNIEVRSPKALPIVKIAVKDEAPGTLSYEKIEKEDEIIHRWQVKNVPQVFPEPDMPPLYTQVQRLLLGTASSWEDISKWYWNLSLPRLEKTTPAMKEKVQRLCEGKTSDMEKIRAIFDFVSQEVRYMGITTEDIAPGFEPRDVHVTFERRYGVCRDKVALLTAMLRIAGFDAYPVLILAGAKKDPDVPNTYFNHAITCVEMENGGYLLMDPTSETQKELLPANLSDKSYLVAKPEGDTLRISPIIPAEKNILTIKTLCEIRKDKSADVFSELIFSGINDTAYRGAFIRRSDEQIKDFLETVIRRSGSEYRLESYEISPEDLSDTERGLRLKITFNIPRIFAGGASSKVLLPPFLSGQFGIANFLIEKMGLEERRFPLFTEIACGISEKLEIRGVDGFKLPEFAFPADSSIENPFFKWTQSYRQENNAIIYKSEFLLKKTEFSREEYKDLKKGLGLRESDLNSYPVSEKIQDTPVADEDAIPESGIRILSEDIELEILDSHSWQESRTFNAMLLDFTGKREISELKFHFNEGTAELFVDYARVISPDGKIKEIRNEEINLMDQPWNSTAPRYPPGKILVLSLPGVDIGSRIECRIVRKNFKQPFVEYFNELRGFYKTLEKKITVKNPKNLKIRYAERIGEEFKEGLITDAPFSRVYTELAPIRRERDIPPAWSRGDFLLLSSGDWENYASKLNERIQNAELGDNQKIQTLLSSIKEKYGNDKMSIIKGIRDFTAMNIRTAGPAFYELPIDFALNLENVLDERYGNSLETAALTGVLLETAGIEHEFILCANFPYLQDELKIQKKCPQFSFFDRVLVKAKTEDGFIYLNDTDQYAELGIVANAGNVGLSLENASFFKIESDKKFRNAIQNTFLIKINENGGAKIRAISEFYGIRHSEMKKNILEMTPERLRRFFQEKAADIMISAKLTGKPQSNFESYPGRFEFTVECGDFAKIANGRMSFSMPNRIKAFRDLLVSRENPYFLSGNEFLSSKYIISIPDAYEATEILPPQKWEARLGSGNYMRISSEIKENKNTIDFFGKNKKFLVVEYSANFASAVFSADEYQELLKKSTEFNSEKKSLALFKKAKDGLSCIFHELMHVRIFAF